MGNVTFKTVKKSNAVIIKQPSIYYERYASGKQQGKVKRKRQIQYVEHLDTIFVDEQKKIEDNPKPTPLYINKGLMSIEEDNITKIDLMTKHPDNVENGGRLFKLLNVEAEELYQIGEFEALDKARTNISEANDNLIRAIAVYFIGHNKIKERVPKLKIILRQMAEQNPKMGKDSNFVKELNKFIQDDNNDEKLMVSLALTEEVISIYNGKTIVWGDSDEAIFTGSQPKDIIREFSVWVKTNEEGREVLNIISEKVDSKN